MNKHSLSPVIASVMLLGITITIGVFFFNFYSSIITNNQESNNAFLGNFEIQYIFANNLVIDSASDYNLSFLQIKDAYGEEMCLFRGDSDISTQDLMVWYTFDNLSYNGSNYIIPDLSGNSRDATLYDSNHSNEDLNTTAQLVKSNQGYALRFDGVDDYARMQYGQEFNTSIHNHSFYIKFKMKSLGSGTQTFLDQGSFVDVGRTIFSYRGNTNSFLSVTGGNSNFLEFEFNYVANTWATYVSNYSVSNTNYTNNVFLNLIRYDHLSSNPESSGNNFFLGKGDRLDGPLNGAIDELRIYNRTLNQSEIENLHWYSIKSQQQGTTEIDISSCNLEKNEQYKVIVIVNGQKFESFQYVS